MQQVVHLSLKDALLKYPDLNNLVLNKDSAMSFFLKQKNKHRRIHTLIVLKDEQPIAWAWLFRLKRFKTKYSFMVYVSHKHRGLKLGTMLYNHCKAISRKRKVGMITFPWDKNSKTFYNKLEVKNKYKEIWSHELED